MNKTKLLIIIIGLILATIGFVRMERRWEFQQRVVMAHEIHKVLSALMFDLSDAGEAGFRAIPVDGSWHSQVAFDSVRQGHLQYLVQGGQLLRMNDSKALVIAQNIEDLRMRREKQAPDILEVQIEAHKGVSLVSNLRVRIHR